MANKVYAFRVPDSDNGVLVYADSPEQAKELLAEPALVEMHALSTKAATTLVFDRELDEEDKLLVALVGAPILTEHKVMAARTSVEAFKNSELKFFGDDRFLVAGKDLDDAKALLEEIVRIEPEAERILHRRSGDAMTEQAKDQFSRPPMVLSRGALNWYKAKAQEPPLMPAPPYVM
jgi:hypothetical protein